jgi:hypothetical protein
MFDLMKIARMGIIALGALAAWGAWLWNHDGKVVEKERASVYKKSNENAAKAQAARRSADKLPADRLRDKFCRDC